MVFDKEYSNSPPRSISFCMNFYLNYTTVTLVFINIIHILFTNTGSFDTDTYRCGIFDTDGHGCTRMGHGFLLNICVSSVLITVHLWFLLVWGKKKE